MGNVRVGISLFLSQEDPKRGSHHLLKNVLLSLCLCHTPFTPSSRSPRLNSEAYLRRVLVLPPTPSIALPIPELLVVTSTISTPPHSQDLYERERENHRRVPSSLRFRLRPSPVLVLVGSTLHMHSPSEGRK